MQCHVGHSFSNFHSVDNSATGDFAVLLKAGMSAKQAVFYNLLSSILCLLGMVLGVFLGESETATAWVFATAAGMFLYIALVDMVRTSGSSCLYPARQISINNVIRLITLLIGILLYYI
jgi:zinc transporter 10